MIRIWGSLYSFLLNVEDDLLLEFDFKNLLDQVLTEVQLHTDFVLYESILLCMVVLHFRLEG